MSQRKYRGEFTDPLPVPPWPTDPGERAELLGMALACEGGWQTANQRDTAYLRGELAKGAGA